MRDEKKGKEWQNRNLRGDGGIGEWERQLIGNDELEYMLGWVMEGCEELQIMISFFFFFAIDFYPVIKSWQTVFKLSHQTKLTIVVLTLRWKDRRQYYNSENVPSLRAGTSPSSFYFSSFSPAPTLPPPICNSFVLLVFLLLFFIFLHFPHLRPSHPRPPILSSFPLLLCLLFLFLSYSSSLSQQFLQAQTTSNLRDVSPVWCPE